MNHPSDYPITAGATGVLLTLAAAVAVLVLLGVLWVALAVGARLALGLAG